MFNGAHLHLLLNHIPLVGLFFSFLFLLFGRIRPNESIVRGGLFIALVSGIFGVLTFLTGEPAEEVIEHLPNFLESLLHEHEEAAEIAIWGIAILTLASCLGMWLSLKYHTLSKFLLNTILTMNFVTLILIGRTSNLGGKINHPEIRESLHAH